MARPKKVNPEAETIKAVGMKKVGSDYVAYVLTITDGQVVHEKLSEVNLQPIVLDMARVFFVDEFMGAAQ